VTTVLVDTSVVVKWFHGEGESEFSAARSIRDAMRTGELVCKVIDLALYELGNVLLRSLSWSPSDVADQLDDLIVLCGTPLSMTSEWFRRAATLGALHGLTYYDSSWAAAAEGLDVPLVSSDRLLLAAGVAESPTDTVQRLRLPMNP